MARPSIISKLFGKKKLPSYPIIPFDMLLLVQGVCSIMVGVLYFVVFSHLKGTSLGKVLEDLENRTDPNEVHAPWYFHVLHLAGILGSLATSIVVVLYFFNRLHPLLSLMFNFAIHLGYIIGVAGVAAKTDVGKCTGSGSGCGPFKAVFFAAQVAGLVAALQMVLDGYVWGKWRASRNGYQYLAGGNREVPVGLQPLIMDPSRKPQMMVSERYDAERTEYES